jgi:hypothetical protein
LRFLNRDTKKWEAQIAVVEAGEGIRWLTELEYINGEIYANIWQTDLIARIDPGNGAIIAWIDLTGLRTSGDVLNGIAYDATAGHLLVTGKWRPWLYRIDVVTGGATPGITTPPPAATLSERARAIACDIAALPAAALAEAKGCIGDPDGYARELEATAGLLARDETQRRVRAFLEKPPRPASRAAPAPRDRQ